MVPPGRAGESGRHGKTCRKHSGDNLPAVNTWYDYRAVWATHPWLLVYAIIVAGVLLLSILGTVFLHGPLAILFVPALGGAYAHHLMVMKRLQAREH
jgi:hypothetical protein